MRIAGSNNVQNNSLACKNAPSFKAKLFLSKECKEIASRELTAFYNMCCEESRPKYFGSNPLDTNKLFEEFQNKFEKMTKKIKGDVMLFPAKNQIYSDRFLRVMYKNEAGEIVSSKSLITPYEFAPYGLLDDGIKFKHAVRLLVGNLSDAIAQTDVGYSRKNPFLKLCKSLEQQMLKLYIKDEDPINSPSALLSTFSKN